MSAIQPPTPASRVLPPEGGDPGPWVFPLWGKSGRRPGRGAAVAALALLLAACVSRDGPPPPRAEINVFISPAGEPFRGGATGAYPVETWFSRVDADRDGALTAAEMEADAKGFFEKLDVNHDGTIDGPEMETYEQHVAPEILPRVARLTAEDVPPLPGTQQPGIQQLQMRPVRRLGRGLDGGDFNLLGQPQPVAAADADLDGRVSLAEAQAAARRSLGRLDKNGDGRLLRAELPQTAAQRLAARAR